LKQVAALPEAVAEGWLLVLTDGAGVPLLPVVLAVQLEKP
jgi:hypothetical protein